MSHMPLPPPLRGGTSFDVIVVGARAAGAATALLLARAGVRTLLLDSDPIGSDASSTEPLTRAGVLLLSRWGLLDGLIAAGTPPVRRTTFRYGGGPVVISVLPSHGVDALYAPRRIVLDGLLVRAAGDAGAVVHDRTPVTDLLRRGNRVVGVLATTPDGRSVDIDAALVVGADGIASTVARRAGATPSRVGAHASVTTYGYWSDLPTDGYEWNYRPDACSGAFPTDHGQVCVRISTSSTRIGSSGVALIRHVVAEGAPELSERLDRASPPGRTQTWPGRRGYVRRSHGPGWALVGDAAWFTDPIGAHGTTAALRDAELLARAVVEGLGHDATLTQALARYEATRDRLGIPVFDVVDRIAGHEWDEAEIADRLLQLSSATAAEVEALAALEPGRAA